MLNGGIVVAFLGLIHLDSSGFIDNQRSWWVVDDVCLAVGGMDDW